MQLSIIIPAFNAEEYIEQCLKSILNNKKNIDFEIIVINDGSTDKTKNIVEQMCKKNMNIKLLNKENEGVSSSRNLGISYAKGKYIMFVDADDELASGWYDNIKKYFKLENDIVYFCKDIIGRVNKKEDLLKYIIGYNKKNICLAAPYSKLIKRELLINNNICFNLNLINGEDMLFNIECLKYVDKIRIINYSFYLYRLYFGQSTKKFDDKIIKSDIEFQTKFSFLIKDFKIESAYKNILIDFSMQNAIIMIYDRISYIKKYKNAKYMIKKLYEYPYDEFKNHIYLLNNMSKLKFFLYKNHLKKILFYFFRICHFIKIRSNSWKFIEI